MAGHVLQAEGLEIMLIDVVDRLLQAGRIGDFLAGEGQFNEQVQHPQQSIGQTGQIPLVHDFVKGIFRHVVDLSLIAPVFHQRPGQQGHQLDGTCADDFKVIKVRIKRNSSSPSHWQVCRYNKIFEKP